MWHRFKNNKPYSNTTVAPGMHGQSISAAAEASVRQLIANGKHKAALESAKEIHKKQGTAASEALLVDAYAARIQFLMQQNLAMEAKALLELVRERYPSARPRLDVLTASAAARLGTLDELLRPLNDPALAPERRTAIEHAIQQEVGDLAAVAGCAAVSPEDPLRKAASALQRAFIAVTSGPVAEDALSLPEVSHRSPLAPWKLLVRAIACFYRCEDESCRQYLGAIKPDAAPARLVPAIQAMLDGKAGAMLTGAAAALVSQTTANTAKLRSALEALEQSFREENESRILKCIRAAVEECRQSAPGQLDRLKQHICVRSSMSALTEAKVRAAIGIPRRDAYFLRLFARGLEVTADPENLALACGVWHEFRQLAAQEGWFKANSAEAATLYLHMAEVLRKIPNEMLRELQRPARQQIKASGEDLDFLFPEKLYERACVLDPHTEAFSQWMDWAAGQAGWQAQRVAEAWHKIRPLDIRPILHLMEASEKKNAFPTALKYLARAEQIDGVHPQVRRARLRLLAGSAMRHIQQKKPNLAEEKLAEMAALPQTQQGDRPAFLAALRYMASAARGNSDQAAVHRAEIERRLESSVAAAILIFGVAAACKRGPLEQLAPVEKLAGAERAALPAALARVTALAEDMAMKKMGIPWAWVVETAKQFPRSSQSLDTIQLRTLAQAALCAGHSEFAYAVSAAGLQRGGPTEARFLLLRARSLPEWQMERRAVCAAAAAALGRQQREMDLVEEAVELLRGAFNSRDLPITLEQAAEVLQKEKAEAAFPTGNRRPPDYSRILGDDLCPCPKCRAARGEIIEPFDDFDDDDEIEELLDDLPEDIPPQIARMLLEEAKRSAVRGESFDQFLSSLMGEGPGKKHKKGRRR